MRATSVLLSVISLALIYSLVVEARTWLDPTGSISNQATDYYNTIIGITNIRPCETRGLCCLYPNVCCHKDVDCCYDGEIQNKPQTCPNMTPND